MKAQLRNDGTPKQAPAPRRNYFSRKSKPVLVEIMADPDTEFVEWCKREHGNYRWKTIFDASDIGATTSLGQKT